MPGLIATPSAEGGYSDPMEVGGRKGRFNWGAGPRYDPGVGRGRSPMYLFETDDGESWAYRLEEDMQGGRWEESGQVEEYELMKQNPEVIYQMWGDGPVAKALENAVRYNLPWESLPDFLKGVNTWRQISGD